MRRVIGVLAAHLVLAIVASPPVARATASPTAIRVDDPRPVAAAIRMLKAKYGWRVTYEDPPYPSTGGAPVATQPVSNGVANGPADENFPKGGSFATSIASEAEPAAIASMVTSFNTSRGMSLFGVVQGNGLVHVVPRGQEGPSGTFKRVVPVLDTTVTVVARDRSALAFLGEVTKALSAETGIHIVVGTVPTNFLINTTTSMGATNESARSVLERLFVELDARLSWQFLYDPDLKWYVLNIDSVMPASKT